MVVLSPCDDNETRKAVFAAAEYQGPVYIRLGSLATPDIFDSSYEFKIGKAATIKEGKDVTVIATGMLTAEALEAAKTLEAEGVSVRVINMSTIKPLDEEAIRKAVQETKFIVTAEEHSVIGGLGGAVSEFTAENCPAKVVKIGVYDRFGESGTGEELMVKFNLKAVDIVKKIKDNL